MLTPFAPFDWPKGDLRQAAEVLWKWHRSASNDVPSNTDHIKAHAICKEFNLPIQLIDLQLIKGEMKVIKTAPHLFDYMDAYAGSHALLLAKLAGYTGNWIETPIKQFGRAIFLTRSIWFLKQDLQDGKFYIPLDIMNTHGLSKMDLMKDKPSRAVRSVLWKQIVQARDAYASCRTLNSDLNGWAQRRFRIYWAGGLNMLARVESRRFNLWSKPPRLSLLQKTHVYLRAYIGKST